MLCGPDIRLQCRLPMISPLEPTPGVAFDTREYRHALGRFATGITIVTARDSNGSPVGLTVNSFNSVSLDPPLIVWSLAQHSPTRAAFEGCSHFAVNVLSHDQEWLSRQFAAKSLERYAGVDFIDGAGGAPLLDGCCAWFECHNQAQYQGGDHVVFIGRVERYARRNLPPLVYHGGSYHQLADAS